MIIEECIDLGLSGDLNSTPYPRSKEIILSGTSIDDLKARHAIKLMSSDACQGDRMYSLCTKHEGFLVESIRFCLPPSQWINVGKKYFARPDMLKGGKHALLSLDIRINSDGYVRCNMQVGANVFIPVKIDDLLPNHTLINIYKLNGSIDAEFLENRLVYILPNMTRATIVRISEDCPTDCFLTSYEEYRQYWSTAYGYELSNFRPKAYISVVFPGFEHMPALAYPIECVQSQGINLIRPVRNESQITKEFSTDLQQLLVMGSVINLTSSHMLQTSSTTPELFANGGNIDEVPIDLQALFMPASDMMVDSLNYPIESSWTVPDVTSTMAVSGTPESEPLKHNIYVKLNDSSSLRLADHRSTTMVPTYRPRSLSVKSTVAKVNEGVGGVTVLTRIDKPSPQDRSPIESRAPLQEIDTPQQSIEGKLMLGKGQVTKKYKPAFTDEEKKTKNGKPGQRKLKEKSQTGGTGLSINSKHSNLNLEDEADTLAKKTNEELKDMLTARNIKYRTRETKKSLIALILQASI